MVFSQRRVLQKVCLFDVHRREGVRHVFPTVRSALDRIRPLRPNLLGQAHFDHMPRFAPLDQAQSALRNESAHRGSYRPCGQPDITCQPSNRKSQAEFSFQATVPQKVRIDGAFDGCQAQVRRKVVFQLFPDKFGVRFFVFHVFSPIGGNKEVDN